MKVFYHDDNDGKCSAYIVKKYLEESNFASSSQDFIASNYDKKFDFHQVQKYERVYVLDFSFKEDEWMGLFLITKNVVWIDHHITAIEKYNKFGLEGKRSIVKAACELTWDYFYPFKEYPTIVNLVADFDMWRFNYRSTLSFHYGSEIIETDPTSYWWDLFFKDINEIQRIVDKGSIIKEYIEIKNKEKVKNTSFIRILDGYECLCCNNDRGMKLFDTVHNNSTEIFLTFIFDGYNFNVSLYSAKEGIDVSKVASKYGGGGHKSASGFICKTLDFSEMDIKIGEK